jgi:hypothetical protein
MFAAASLLWAALAAQSPDSGLTATFTVLRGASARFRQDLMRASPQLVMARADQVRVACAGSGAAADSLAPLLRSNAAAQADLAVLQRALRACQREWDTTGPRANADSLRAWGPYRLSELDRAMRRYQHARARRGARSSK